MLMGVCDEGLVRRAFGKKDPPREKREKRKDTEVGRMKKAKSKGTSRAQLQSYKGTELEEVFFVVSGRLVVEEDLRNFLKIK
jgi:hypothetical protein